MSVLRGVVRVVVAVVYVALVGGAVRLYGAAQAEAQRVGGVAQVRVLVLVLGGVGVLVGLFTLWAARHAVAAAVAAALLTLVVVVEPPLLLVRLPRPLADAAWTLGLGRFSTFVLLAWGASVVALVAAVATRGRGRHRRRV